MEEAEKLRIDVVIGEEAHRFFEGPLGQRMLAEHLNRVAELHKAFETLEYSDTEKMQKIWMDLKIERQWLVEFNAAMTRGEESYMLITETGQ